MYIKNTTPNVVSCKESFLLKYYATIPEQQKKLYIRHYVYLLLHVYQYPNKINNSLNSVQFQLIWWNFI